MSQSEGSEGALSDDDAEAALKPLYAYEKIYHDAADKERIAQMSLIEREAIIGQRNDEVDRYYQDIQLHRLVASRAKLAERQEKKAKRKADEAGLDENQRKSSRQRTKVGGESRAAIDRYKQQRAEKNIRDENRRQNRSARSVTPNDDYSDDAQGESDDYDDRRRPAIKKRSPSPVRDDPPATLDEINHVRIGRENFAQVCQTPGFEAAVTGCYARINLGPGRDNTNVYRLCYIKGLTKSKPYAMVAPNGQQFLTDKYILAAHGKAEKAWSFLETSMQRFTPEEWNRYRATMANEEMPMPKKSSTVRKLEDLNKLISHKWTDPEITAKLDAQSDLMAMVTKSKEKDEITDQIIEARRTRNYELVDELQEKLQNIVPMKLAMGTSLIKKEAPKVNTEQERLAALNRKNNQFNTENIRKAQLAEMHARRIRQQQKRADTPPIKDDLFGDGSDISRTATPLNGAGTPVRGGTPNPASGVGTPRSSTPIPLKPVVKKKNGIPVIRKAALDDEIIAGIDLGLEI